ncbi:hypothetical protein ACH24_02005 [Francisella persica ATCC VR-331]|uniref:SIMPL domain-containing protein n=1 Tax=Francisella persica ATCC VR-331 TaxID=1086726 RepID=A0AAC8VD07_9GAMM|nr:hypothetical protein [Francisella persica]ALB01538.1 hypothetical protein ACH24_02005 [Francisella persica ATCC VR-331]ANH77830.1 hypothetical protein FSC845_04805 [Francisella persica ATCC VR-331]
MKKKIISITLVSLFTTTSFAIAFGDCHYHNTIKYSAQAETTVKSESILVQVTGYATTTFEKQNSIEKQISGNVNNIVKSNWKVKKIEQTASNSGAINITIKLQARISQSDLNKLQTAFENQDKSSGTKLVVDVLDYNPPAKDIQAAKQKLMIKLFNDTKDYLANFNKQTNSNYTIQSIQYIDVDDGYQPRNNLMLMKTSYNANASSNSYNTIAVSQCINIKANVTFMEK